MSTCFIPECSRINLVLLRVTISGSPYSTTECSSHFSPLCSVFTIPWAGSCPRWCRDTLFAGGGSTAQSAHRLPEGGLFLLAGSPLQDYSWWVAHCPGYCPIFLNHTHNAFTKAIHFLLHRTGRAGCADVKIECISLHSHISCKLTVCSMQSEHISINQSIKQHVRQQEHCQSFRTQWVTCKEMPG